MTTLIKYDAARHALQQAVEIDEVKDIRDKAQAMAAYAKQANDTKLIEWATEIKVRAERKAGQMLAELPKNPGAATRCHDVTALPKTLSQLGINKKQSSRWQKLAAVPEDQFEQAITAAKEVAGEVTTAAMLRIEKEIKRQNSQSHEKFEPAPKKEKQELKVVESDSQEEPTYDPRDDDIREKDHIIAELAEENEKLKVSIANGMVPEGLEIDDIDSILDNKNEEIDRLNKEIRTLRATLSSVEKERDRCYVTIKQLKETCNYWEKRCKKSEAVNA